MTNQLARVIENDKGTVDRRIRSWQQPPQRVSAVCYRC